jgi:hypothetical protein
MKKAILLIIVLSPFLVKGQKKDSIRNPHFPRHFISFNPLNAILFQQIGITYEFKPGRMGYGITSGYIYPNKKEYSNWFIAGPTNYGSLGFYSGVYFIPQFNIYLTMQKKPKKAGLVYLTLKGVYKYLKIDSTNGYAWDTHADDSYWVYRKMVDRTNVIGVFLDFGFKFIRSHFFFDLNIGPGIMFVNHNMIIAGETTKHPSHVSNISPPRSETFNDKNFTINFTLTFGVDF